MFSGVTTASANMFVSDSGSSVEGSVGAMLLDKSTA